MKKRNTMKRLDTLEAWFLTGSQTLYGEKTLLQVEKDSKAIARALSDSSLIPVKVAFKPVLTNPEGILEMCRDANRDTNCIGVIAWMHTFSPAKMWIAGLKALQKPLLHLHTQFNRDIPWESIDMDFMNLNQSAHGGREFGFMVSRLRLPRKVVVGYWQDPGVKERVAVWTRAAAAWHDAQGARIARFGDNMREVAVTEGDKVEAQIRFGYSVNGYALGELVDAVARVPENEVDGLLKEYDESYLVAETLKSEGAQRQQLRESARIELGIESFLREGGFKAFTTCFENLHGLSQLPGLAVQRLMAAGYGFGAEGDWKTAALVRAMKVMSQGLNGGTSFMEDYTYHLSEGAMKVLGAHMLEVCASLAGTKPSLEIHPLSIGNREDPARLVFNVQTGPGLNATIVDMGNRFRMVVNEVEVVEPDAPLPRLPVARALWVPHPDLKTAAAAWILAGGAHHASFSKAVKTEHLEDFADMAGIEFLLIDGVTRMREFKKELRWNELYYGLAGGR
jgi:L-arabinose isomerase